MNEFFDNEDSEIKEEKEKNKQNQVLLGGFLGLVLFSVVRVITENTSGSGTLLSREGYFLTNYHVVNDTRVHLVLFSKEPRKSPEKYFFTKITSQDNNLDLAG